MFGIPTVTIAKTTVESAASSVTLTVDTSMLSFTARHLVVRANAIHETMDDGVYFRINGDTGSNYDYQNMKAVGGTETASHNYNGTLIPLWKTDDEANIFGGGEWLLPDALSTRTHKNIVGTGGQGETYGVWYTLGRWGSTAAVTSVTFILTGGNFDEGSDFELCVVDENYAIAGAEDILTGSQSSFSQGSITAGTGNLACIANLRTDRVDYMDGAVMEFNSDTTAGNYYSQRFRGAGTGVNAASDTQNSGFLIPATNSDANAFGAFVCVVPNYSDGSNDRNSLAMSGALAGSGYSISHAGYHQMSWNNTAGITTVDLKPNIGSNFVANSMFSFYLIPGDSDDLIERIELASDTDTIKFDSIPDTYDHLEITAYLRLDRSATSMGNELFVNNDKTAGNHAAQYMNASDTTVTGAVYTSWPGLVVSTGDTSTANQFAVAVITAYNYKKTDRHKHIMITSGYSDQGSTDDRVSLTSKRWKSTSAITVLEIDHDSSHLFMAGSIAELRGISSEIGGLTSVSFIPETRMF